MSAEIKKGDYVFHPACREWGQGVVIAINSTQIEARFLDADPKLRKLSIKTPLETIAEADIDSRFSDPVAAELNEESLWKMILSALADEKVRCKAQGKEQLIIPTKIQGRENIVTIGDSKLERRSKQPDGRWGDPRPIKKHELWKLAKFAIKKGEHVLEDTPPGQYFGCFGCAILDLLDMFECIPSSGGRKQRIRYEPKS